MYDTTNSGLPSNWVYDIVIDNAGNKWIGEVDDAGRFTFPYDGTKFKNIGAILESDGEDEILNIVLEG